jgi:uncharacterized repeat protein (TIGR01451 family)
MKILAKKLAAFLAATLLCATLLSSATAYGPDRQTLAPATPADKPIFNSIISDEKDERDFVQIRECPDGFDLSKEPTGKYDSGNLDANGKPTFKIEPGKVYEVNIYYHNNAKSDGNASEENNSLSLSAATGTKAMVILPLWVQAGEAGAIQGQIYADNVEMYDDNSNLLIDDSGKPQNAVWDDVSFYCDVPISMRFLPGSAKHFNNIGFPTGQGLPSAFVSGFDTDGNTLPGGGALIATQNLDKNNGIVLAGLENAGFITLRVLAASVDFETKTTVSRHGTDDWRDAITARPGDLVDVKIWYKNSGQIDQLDVTAKALLPEGLEYVAGSSRLLPAGYSKADNVSDQIVSDAGINITSGGEHNARGGAEGDVVFSARVAKKPLLGSAKQIVAGKIITSNGTKESVATISVRSSGYPLWVLLLSIGVAFVTGFSLAYLIGRRKRRK